MVHWVFLSKEIDTSFRFVKNHFGENVKGSVEVGGNVCVFVNMVSEESKKYECKMDEDSIYADWFKVKMDPIVCWCLPHDCSPMLLMLCSTASKIVYVLNSCSLEQN